MSLFDRLLKVRKGDFGIIKEYLKFCIQVGSVKNFYRVFVKNTKYFGQVLEYWLIAVYYEFEVRRNIFKARDLFLKGIATNNDQLAFLVEYLEFESRFFKLIEERQKYLMQTNSHRTIINGEKETDLNNQGSDVNNSDIDEVIEFEDDDESNISNQNINNINNDTIEEMNIDKTTIFNGIISKILDILRSKTMPDYENKSLIEKALEIYGNTVKERNEVFEQLEQYYMNTYNETLFSSNCFNYFYEDMPVYMPTELKNLSFKESLSFLSNIMKTKNDEINLNTLSQFINSLNIAQMTINDFVTNINLFDQIASVYIDRDIKQVPKSIINYLQSHISNIDCFRMLMKLETDNNKALKLLKDSINRISMSTKFDKTNSATVLHKEKLMSAFLGRLEKIRDAIESLDTNSINEMIKIAGLKKEILSIIADYLIKWMDTGRLSRNIIKTIEVRFMGLKNYCPAHMAVYLLKKIIALQKETVFEEFLRYYPKSIELWKLYLILLRKLTKIGKIEQAFNNGINELSEQERQEWTLFYKQN